MQGKVEGKPHRLARNLNEADGLRSNPQSTETTEPQGNSASTEALADPKNSEQAVPMRSSVLESKIVQSDP